jgi:N-acetylglucosamine-6-sulfatase
MTRHRLLLLIAALALGAAGCGSEGGQTSTPRGPVPKLSNHPLNVVVVMTDDQRSGDLTVMPTVEHQLVDRGVTFANNFATYPLCCPSRTTFLTGQYAHNHGILTNDAPEGGYEGFVNTVDPADTIGVKLQAAGYRTGIVGKFLNEYNPASPGEIPSGWNVFDVLYGIGEYAMFGYGMNENGTSVSFGDSPRDYKTDVLTRLATSFIRRSATAGKPFFLTYTPVAPHDAPAVPGVRNPQPAPRDAKAFLHRALPRPPSFGAPITGEPKRLRESPQSAAETAAITSAYRDRLASLLAVDRGVRKMLAALRQTGELRHTVFIFTSDNGFLLGEHAAEGKERPYEESVKVPLVIRGPGIPQGATRDQLVGNIDLSPTILDIAKQPWREGTDGVSLLGPALDPTDWNQRPILYEGSAQEGRGYHAIRTPRYAYVHYLSGAQELFDLQKDPGELHNVVHAPEYADVVDALRPLLVQLAKCSGDSCRQSLPELPGPSR